MKKWNVKNQTSPKTIDEIIEVIYHNRDIQKNKIKIIPPKDISPKDVGIDTSEMKKAKKRIEKAMSTNEGIIIFGDYDADGVCATTILWEEIFSRTKQVMPYLPDRKEEGYGLSKKAIDNLLNKYPKTSLIITVDNGIVAQDAINYAKKKNIDTIITDHHTKGEKYPNAYAIIYTTELAGAGVAWMLAKEITKDTNSLIKKLDLVAIATIADMVPLKGHNHTLVKEGLTQLNTTDRIGLKEIVHEAQIKSKKIGVSDIGFLIAPRINAAGRMGHAIDSLRLLCTQNKENAMIYAAKIGAQNRKRQSVTESLTNHAKTNAKQKNDEKIIIAQDESYDEGVIGLIASKLVEEFYLPSIAISKGNEVSKGSARSIKGVNIIDIIRKAGKHLTSAGGHPMAAGFSVETNKLDHAIKIIKEEASRAVTDDLLIRQLSIDTALDITLASELLHKQIQQLYPFGIGNPEPIFLSKGVLVQKADAVGKDRSHLKLLLERKNGTIDAIAFGLAQSDSYKPGDLVDIAYIIDINEWNGRKKLSLKIKDLKKIT